MSTIYIQLGGVPSPESELPFTLIILYAEF